MLAQTHTDAATPTGATLVPGGATFRVWAPRASAVYLNGSFGGVTYDKQTDDRLLANNGTGYWTGFQAGAADGDTYRYWVVGAGGSGYKRDPYARELSPAGFPNCFSILRAVDAYPWHDAGFRTPDFTDRRCGRRCDCGCNFRRGHLVELHARLPHCWPVEGSVQQ